MSNLKEYLIKKYKSKPYEIGEKVFVNKDVVLKHMYCHSSGSSVKCIIKDIDNENISICLATDSNNSKVIVVNENDLKRDIPYIGANPFPEKDWRACFNKVNYTLSGIMVHLGIPYYQNEERKYKIDGVEINGCNYNPFIIDKDGNRQYYQRDFVWSLKDEQNFIESIYQNIDCGKIVLRDRSWDWVEKQVKNGNCENIGFVDIVDGKQRINTLQRFMNDEFKDLHGNYFSDLSNRAIRQFEQSTCISTLIMREESSDEDAIRTFLMINYSGKPLSKQHLKYVKEISEKM